jgi:hypothetical protein
MKRVLIISYLFPPNTTIVSSLRPYSWFKEFDKYNIEPVAVTRHWSSGPTINTNELIKENLSPAKTEMLDGHVVHYLPYKKSFGHKAVEYCEHSKWLKPFGLLLNLSLLLRGKFCNEPDINYAFKKHVLALLKKEKFDAVILTALPVSAITLAYHIKKRTNLPVIVDFRDYWNNNLLNEEYKFSFRAKFYFYIQEIYIKKWLKHIDTVISVSQPILDKLEKFTKAEKQVIYNGFEKDLFKNIPVEPVRNVFRITILGAIYHTQDISFMLTGFKEFLAGKDSEKIQICFIGLKYFKDVSDQVEKKLPAASILVTQRIRREEGLAYALNADVLYYPGWPGYKGIYSGKIFEYLGAKRNILIAPGDKDVLDELISKTNTGKLADTTAQMVSILNDWYNEWTAKGTIDYHGKDKEIEEYTRENQARILAKYIHKDTITNHI